MSEGPEITKPNPASLSHGATPSETDRYSDLIRAAKEHVSAGRAPEGRRLLAEALDVARRNGDPQQLAYAALRYVGTVPTAGIVDDETIALLNEASNRLQPNDLGLVAQIKSRMALELAWTKLQESRSLASDALDAARRSNDVEALGYSLYANHFLNMHPEAIERRLQIGSELLRIAGKTNDHEIAWAAHNCRAYDYLELGNRAGFDLEVAILRQHALDAGYAGHQFWIASYDVLAELMRGALGVAEATLYRALTIGLETHEKNSQHIFAAQLFRLRFHQGRLAELLPGSAALVDQYPAMPGIRCTVAFMRAVLGSLDEARQDLEILAADSFNGVRRDMTYLGNLTLLADTCAILHDVERAAKLYDLLSPFTGRIAPFGAAMCLGPVSRVLGRLAGMVDHPESASRHFDDSIKLSRRIGSALFEIQCQCDYAEWLGGLDTSAAKEILDQAARNAHRLSIAPLSQRIDSLVSELRVTNVATTAPKPSVPSSEKLLTIGEHPRFRLEGNIWSIEFEGRAVRLRDLKGLRYLDILVRHPGEEFHVSELLSGGATPFEGRPHEVTAQRWTAARSAGHAGDVLDAKAKAEYVTRARELKVELQSAERTSDLAAATRVRRELDFLESELISAFGLGGRARKAADIRERVRKSVANRIRAAVGMIEKHHEALGMHLDRSLRLGTFCSYQILPRMVSRR